MVQYPYAYQGEKLVSASEAERQGCFYLLDDQGIEIEMILVKGEKNQPHFRTKHLGQFALESVEHLQLKAEIARRKWINYNGLKIEAATVEIEKRHGQLGKNGRRPDLTFIDNDGEILCFIEIVHTHKPAESYLVEAYESNLLIFEISTHDQKRVTRHLGKRDSLYIEQRVSQETKRRVSGIERSIQDTERRIAEHDDQITAIKAELYFAELERFRAGFAKIEGEAGIVIRNIAEIEEQIKAIMFNSPIATP